MSGSEKRGRSGVILGIQNANAQDITHAPVLRTSYSYTGREFDSESGNFYYRARYYDSATGRMLQKDPHPGIPEIPGSVNNAYTYGLNNPIIHTDPSGRILPFIAAVAIGAIIGGLVNTAVHGFDWSQFGTGAAIGAILTVAAVSGGAAGGLVGGALGGGFAGAAGGAVAGAIVGGLIGGIGYELTGVGSFGQGFIAGAISGGIAGAFQGYTSVAENSNTNQLARTECVGRTPSLFTGNGAIWWFAKGWEVINQNVLGSFGIPTTVHTPFTCAEVPSNIAYDYELDNAETSFAQNFSQKLESKRDQI